MRRRRLRPPLPHERRSRLAEFFDSPLQRSILNGQSCALSIERCMHASFNDRGCWQLAQCGSSSSGTR